MRDPKFRSSHVLWYRQPASNWEEALPIGNGNLGGMIFGDVQDERIDLNEDTLWSGFARDTNNYDAIRHLERARDLVFTNRYREAEAVVERHMLGPWHECYLPLGSLRIRRIGSSGMASEYERSLDLKTGVSTTVFTIGGSSYRREAFMSAPDQCMALRITCTDSRGISIAVKLDSHLRHMVEYCSQPSPVLLLSGQCPSHVEPNYIEDHPRPILYEDGKGLRFMSGVEFVTDQGDLIWNSSSDELEIRNANAVTILVVAATDFSETHSEGYDRERDLHELVLGRLETTGGMTYEELKDRHIADFEALSTRTELILGETACSGLPTDLRLQAVNDGARDPELAALYCHYGRYLLISSSRAGTRPANLQGIWSHEVRAPWGSNWTANINVQMNYWHAETANLPECHQALFSWITRLAERGKRTARIHYNSRGWAAHHNVDLWMDTSPANGQAVWAFWPMTAAWLCSHLWAHYSFNEDERFLRQEAFPIMKDAAEFYLDWLIADPETGRLITNPSTSPENKFMTDDGEPCAISKATTLDLLLISELFQACIAVTEVLNQDREWAIQLKQAISELQPLRIGSDGRLQEWVHEFEEWEPGHRHLSHLYGMYPGGSIVYGRDPELTRAVRASLEYRLSHGGGRTGWSCAWAMALWARLRDGEQAHANWLALLTSSTFPNLFNGHPYMVDTCIDYSRSIFQIDGNFGTAAAIVECLLQSHAGEIHLLPALPEDWSDGEALGLRARGGVTVDIAWQEGKVREVRLLSDQGGRFIVRSAVPLHVDGQLVQSLGQNDDYCYALQLKANESFVMVEIATDSET